MIEITLSKIIEAYNLRKSLLIGSPESRPKSDKILLYLMDHSAVLNAHFTKERVRDYIGYVYIESAVPFRT